MALCNCLIDTDTLWLAPCNVACFWGLHRVIFTRPFTLPLSYSLVVSLTFDSLSALTIVPILIPTAQIYIRLPLVDASTLITHTACICSCRHWPGAPGLGFAIHLQQRFNICFFSQEVALSKYCSILGN